MSMIASSSTFILFTVAQWASLIFHNSYNYWINISASMNDIRIMEMIVFTQFGYGLFNDAICFWWAPMYVHQLPSFQCCSV